MIEFFVPWTVSAKQGRQHRVRYGANGKAFAQSYTAADVRENAESLATFVAKHRPQEPMAGEIRAVFKVVYAFRADQLKKREAALRRGREFPAEIPKGTKPDCDNCCKQIADTLERTGFFANDSQIYDVRIVKVWGLQPGVFIKLESTEAASGNARTQQATGSGNQHRDGHGDQDHRHPRRQGSPGNHSPAARRGRPRGSQAGEAEIHDAAARCEVGLIS